MSLCAIIPIANLLAANQTLEQAGFGPGNFSVPAYTGPGATHAALHAWDDPVFQSAVEALPGVVTEVSDGDPVTRTKALIEAQGAIWGARSPVLPDSGIVTAGEMYRYGETGLWSVIQTHDRSIYGGDPSQYPALIRYVRNPGVVEEWKQPIDQYDAYQLVNPFTGEPDHCLFNDQEWYVSAGDASGLNVWAPGVYGWTLVGEDAPADPGDPPATETWTDTGVVTVASVGALYQLSATVVMTANERIRLGTFETKFTGYWPTAGTPSAYIAIDPNPPALLPNGTHLWRLL